MTILCLVQKILFILVLSLMLLINILRRIPGIFFLVFILIYAFYVLKPWRQGKLKVLHLSAPNMPSLFLFFLPFLYIIQSLVRRWSLLDQGWDLTPWIWTWGIFLFLGSLIWILPWLWILRYLWQNYFLNPWCLLVDSWVLYFLQYSPACKFYEYWTKFSEIFLFYASWPCPGMEYVGWWHRPLCFILGPFWASHYLWKRFYLLLWLTLALLEPFYHQKFCYVFLVYYSYFLAWIFFLQLFRSYTIVHGLARSIGQSNYLYGSKIIYPKYFSEWTLPVMKDHGYRLRHQPQDYNWINVREKRPEPGEFGPLFPRYGYKHTYFSLNQVRWTHTLAFPPLPILAWARLWWAANGKTLSAFQGTEFL